jgi:hypothetical protein
VRITAIQNYARSGKERATIETRLAPFLADTNKHVARATAIALLEPELCQASGYYWLSEFFHYENVQASFPNQQGYSVQQRPLEIIDRKPAFLASVRAALTRDDLEASAPFALLLAQYGEFDGLDLLTAQKIEHNLKTESMMRQVILAGIGLSQNPKYIPFLRGLMDATKNQYEYQNILKALKGMTGPEARQMRLDLNKRIRRSNNAIGVMD